MIPAIFKDPPAPTFSIRYIQAGRIVTIPEEQQMLLYQFIDIADEAELDLSGELVIL